MKNKIFCIILILLLNFANPVFALKWHNVSDLSKEEKENIEQTKSLFDMAYRVSYPNEFYEIDANSMFQRFYILCNAEINKCGLYDKKKDRFTGYVYKYAIKVSPNYDGKIHAYLNNFAEDNEIIGHTFSGVPIVIENGKKKSVQPVKRVGNSIARGSGRTLGTILLMATAPVTIPVAALTFWIIGLEETKATKERNTNTENNNEIESDK